MNLLWLWSVIAVSFGAGYVLCALLVGRSADDTFDEARAKVAEYYSAYRRVATVLAWLSNHPRPPAAAGWSPEQREGWDEGVEYSVQRVREALGGNDE